ncbi:MAG: hypothetical protein IPL99_29300 [Candidatus Competibacteraceae bacterium]|nr:hypothetical protein [Candidatus Competibacteraceae bacterium]
MKIAEQRFSGLVLWQTEGRLAPELICPGGAGSLGRRFLMLEHTVPLSSKDTTAALRYSAIPVVAVAQGLARWVAAANFDALRFEVAALGAGIGLVEVALV